MIILGRKTIVEGDCVRLDVFDKLGIIIFKDISGENKYLVDVYGELLYFDEDCIMGKYINENWNGLEYEEREKLDLFTISKEFDENEYLIINERIIIRYKKVFLRNIIGTVIKDIKLGFVYNKAKEYNSFNPNNIALIRRITREEIKLWELDIIC